MNDTTSQRDLSVIGTFLFKDGSLGQLSVEEEVRDYRYGWDMANIWLVLNRNGKRQGVLALFHNSLGDADLYVDLAGSIQFAISYGEFQSWDKVITLDEEGTGLSSCVPRSGSISDTLGGKWKGDKGRVD